MGYRIENKATELLIYDTDGKNITYYPKSELSVSASNGNIIITRTVGDSVSNIFSQEASKIDDPSVNSVYELVTTIKAYLQSDGGDNFSGGWADYNDNATSGTPLSVIGGGAAVVLTNDTLGTFTNTSNLPDGVTSLWNPSTNKFVWTDLKIGDMVDIRLDITITTASANTSINVLLHLGTGGGAYVIPFIQEHLFKTSGTHQITRFNSIYMGDSNTINNGGQFKITADSNCTVKVNGWYVRCIRKGIV